MVSPAGQPREFFYRFDRQGESICLSCFQTVKSSSSETLRQAEDEHRKKCPNGMKIPEDFPPAT
jgi:hypothetical protein